jgi:hypothetical protein
VRRLQARGRPLAGAPRVARPPRRRAREAAVPEAVIRRMTERWEIPARTEAHEIVLAVR